MNNPALAAASTMLRAMRPPFLVLTPICVLLGASLAFADQGALDSVTLALIIAGALAAHISVNALNEYLDFSSGLDLITQRTAFSGGSGALPGHPDGARLVLALGLVTLGISIATGISLVWQHGPELLAIGVPGVALIVTYTQWLNRNPWLCLVAPGLGFGVLMVIGAQYLLQGEFTLVAGLVCAVPFLLVNNLLLLNQFPDIAADASVGRRHLPIVLGTRIASHVYAAFALASTGVVAAGVWLTFLPPQSLLALLPMPLAVFAWLGARRLGDQIGSQPRFLAANVVVAILVPALLALTIAFGG